MDANAVKNIIRNEDMFRMRSLSQTRVPAHDWNVNEQVKANVLLNTFIIPLKNIYVYAYRVRQPANVTLAPWRKYRNLDSYVVIISFSKC